MDNIISYYLALNGLTEGGQKVKAQHHAKEEEEEKPVVEEKPKAVEQQQPAKKEEPKKEEKKDDDDIDLFGDDPEADAEWEKKIQERADEAAAKKEATGKKKEALKSAIIIDVKPWDDTTDLAKMEEAVRTVAMEGLEWKASKLVAIGYGIKKLQISCHVVDELVSVDDVQEKIQEFEDLVQSTDIVSFTKL